MCKVLDSILGMEETGGRERGREERMERVTGRKKERRTEKERKMNEFPF